MRIGYARVSTSSQTTAPQVDELHRAGCEKIFSDVASGAKAERPGLAEMLAQARKGDVLVVARLDRLGRSLVHLVDVIRQLQAAGVGFRSLAESMDTTTAGGKLIFHVFASLAEFERALITERVTAGLSAARARGRVGGRPPKKDHTRQAMAAAMLADPRNTVADVCRALKVSRATAFRLAAKGRAATPPARTPTASSGGSIRTATDTGEAARTERGVPPQAAAKAASSSRQPRAATSKAKTPITPKKGTKTTSKRKS